MDSARQITESQFLLNSHKQKIFLQRHIPSPRYHFHQNELSSHQRPRYGISLRCSVEARPQPVVSMDSTSAVIQQLDQSGEHVVHFYRIPLMQDSATAQLLKLLKAKVSNQIMHLKTEQCFNIGLNMDIPIKNLPILKWLLAETYEPENLAPKSFLSKEEPLSDMSTILIEVGPRLSFTTAWSANAVSICQSCGLPEVVRMERSRRYKVYVRAGNNDLNRNQIEEIISTIHDKMTECVYTQKLTSFKMSIIPEEFHHVRVMENGREALVEINKKMGLAFDEQDIDYYTRLFCDDMKRDPTTVELFDIAQSNSEHSRHWFFKGKIVIDGKPMNQTLMEIVKSTLQANLNNSVIGFNDNSSAIRGYRVKQLRSSQPGSPCPMVETDTDLDILFTAETHNFPCAVAPYPGAETGVGGRIRDTHATGRGSLVIASTAGYCVGNLNIEGSYSPWEDSSFVYPSNLASPLRILIEASNGASDYGNKFGEPLIQGYTRTFGSRLPNGERREWLKPIMFSAGIGQINHCHVKKQNPEIGMLVVKIGGPAYRIGMGGGSASSLISGDNDADLDYNAVQRGDAEMAQKLYRVVRACVELGDANPIVSIHDQGAGGNCNVVKEIIYPLGAAIDVRAIVVGDHTMSVLEIWGAEYQEQDAILVRPESRGVLESLCGREKVSMAVIGTISGEGRIVLVDDLKVKECRSLGIPPPNPAVDLELEKVLGDMPQKCFEFNRILPVLEPLDIAPGISLMDALKRVLRLPSVCSKRFLTTKVDRCVSGLVAQQQTVGPLQIPLSDVAVVAQSYTSLTGAACAIGEQPIKGLINPKSMARLALGEALTNLVWANITSLSDVKTSANWMFAAKLPGEGPAIYDAASALSEAMKVLKIAVDGGKDSLSMAARASGELVVAPGSLVVSAYVTCKDITKTVTPDFKKPGGSWILHIDIGKGRRRLGGSALAQVFDQIGDVAPDLDDVAYLKSAFDCLQDLISDGLVSAGHDVSDGGIIVCVLEMAFAGNCGVTLEMGTGLGATILESLFAEELGFVIEVGSENLEAVEKRLDSFGVSAERIGRAIPDPVVELKIDGDIKLKEDMVLLRDVWEETSFDIEKNQSLGRCVEKEKEGLKFRKSPSWALSYAPRRTEDKYVSAVSKPKVAIVREEGSNGDREMSAAFRAAGFEAHDVSMSDLVRRSVSLRDFRGAAFVGGFSYADVLGSAKGWAGSIKFDPHLSREFRAFYRRPDTFSLGVCNGCQLMTLLEWVPGDDVAQARFVGNESGRFECRFASVRVERSRAVMLKGMEGSVLGVWAAHGEGRAWFPEGRALQEGLVAVRYCDDSGEGTVEYPFNMNGSEFGVAGICSEDGRHLGMMPHPERSFLMWQFPWYPGSWEVEKGGPSPWLRMFQNAREWCR